MQGGLRGLSLRSTELDKAIVSLEIDACTQIHQNRIGHTYLSVFGSYTNILELGK